MEKNSRVGTSGVGWGGMLGLSVTSFHGKVREPLPT